MLRDVVTRLERILAPILGRTLYPPSSSGVLCIEDQEVVVLNTGRRYRLPGGLIETGEHPREAAKREFKEETSMDAEMGELITIETNYDRIQAIQFFYSAKTKGEFKQGGGNWEGKIEKLDKEQLPE